MRDQINGKAQKKLERVRSKIRHVKRGGRVLPSNEKEKTQKSVKDKIVLSHLSKNG